MKWTFILFLGLMSSSVLYAFDYKKSKEDLKIRWENLLQYKPEFAPYSVKTDDLIAEEFQKLQDLRHELWTNRSLYNVHERLLQLGNDQWPNEWLAFDYNSIDDLEDPYNASRIFLFDFEFIALKEPVKATEVSFFNLLSKHAQILVRLKPEGEYANEGSFSYWENRLESSDDEPVHLRVGEGTLLPYLYTNEWVDDQEIEVSKLYALVQEVRDLHREKTGGPIAVHCAAGVGRTGTFISAYTLANKLDQMSAHEISIEELVLTLSIQRPEMVRSEAQYILLYRFVDYYLNQIGKSSVL